MLKASPASVFVFAAVFGGTLVVVACSSSPDSTFAPDPTKPDAAEDSPGTFSEGGGPDATEGGPTSCSPSKPNPFTPVWKAPARSVAACSAAELKMYWDACLANAGKTETDGTCAAFKAAHATCGACAEPDDQGGPIQWHANRNFYTLNVAGCIAIKQAGTDAGTAGCGEAFNASVDCSRQSCISCITQAKSFALFQTCQNDVKVMGLCKSFDTAATTACGTYTGATSCFPTSSSEPQEAHFTRVVAITCGP